MDLSDGEGGQGDDENSNHSAIANAPPYSPPFPPQPEPAPYPGSPQYSPIQAPVVHAVAPTLIGPIQLPPAQQQAAQPLEIITLD